jgi:hypothetical protein
VPRRALLHDHELWDCFGGGGHAASAPENMELGAGGDSLNLEVIIEPGAGDGALQELCVRPFTASPVCVRGGGIALRECAGCMSRFYTGTSRVFPSSA